MAYAVFLRGVNVGGAKALKPSELARALSDLDVVSIGAAGTFVVKGRTTASAVSARFRDALPFEADVMAVPGKDVLALVAAKPFARLAQDEKPFVSVLDAKPKKLPPLPLDRPEGDWEVRVVGLEGRFALSLRRATGGKSYPNEIVEKSLGVRATTRSWSTMETVARKLDAE